MLLFVGGAARTGKGILVRRLLRDLHWPYLSLDVLKMGLARGVPEFGIDPDAGPIPVAERLWPLVREMSHNLIAEGVPYAIEGEILPKHVAALRQAYPTEVQACFLGYATITPGQKLHAIRSYAGYPNDWSGTCTDAELLPIITTQIAFSRYLVEECATYGLAYFDTSERFVPSHEAVVTYLRALR